VSVWIPDTVRNDYAKRVNALGFRYVRKTHSRLNPLQPPRGCPVRIWFQAVAFVFGQAFGLGTASTLVFFKTLVVLHERLKAQGRFPTMADVLNALEQVDTRGNPDLAGYVHRIVEKLDPLLMACPELEYEVGFDLGQLIEDEVSVVWEMPDDEDVRAFFIMLLLYYIYHYRVRNGHAGRRALHFVLDECLHPLRARSPEAGVPLSTKLITQLRGLGVVLIVVTQLPSLLDQAARADLNVVMCFRNQAQEVDHSARIMRLSPEQADEVPRLKTGRMVLKVPGNRLKGPVLVDTPLFSSGTGEASDEELDRISEESVRDLVPGTKPAARLQQASQPARSDPNELSDDEVRCLSVILLHPELIESRCSRLGWDRDREYAARDKLCRRSLAQHAGNIGNKRRIYAATPKGAAYGRQRGWRLASYKSGPLHEAARVEVKMGMARSLTNVRLFDAGFADTLGGIQPDLVVQTGGGHLFVVQVCDRNKAGYECERLLDLCRVEAVDLVVSVSVNRETREKLEKELTGRVGKVWPSKLVVMEIETCLSAGYDWSWLLEKGA